MNNVGHYSCKMASNDSTLHKLEREIRAMQIDLNENPGNFKGIFAVTDYSTGYWEGSGEAMVFDGENILIYNLGHCSCYGPMDDGPSEQMTLENYLENAENLLCCSCSAKVRAEFDKMLNVWLANPIA